MIDLAGFTALTEAHGDEQAADTAVQFADVAEHALGPSDALVKRIGDAVLLASATPADGIGLVRRILDECDKLNLFPATRTGLHHGSAVRRGDDYFGAAVNLTARVAAQAAGGQVICTEPVAEAARQAGIGVVRLGTREFKNVEGEVTIYELALGASHLEATDPVCRMRLNPATAVGHLRHDGTDYWFCSTTCTSKFLAGLAD